MITGETFARTSFCLLLIYEENKLIFRSLPFVTYYSTVVKKQTSETFDVYSP